MMRETKRPECNLQVKQLLWFVFAASRGGKNRMNIVSLLTKRPLNTNQLAIELDLDYKDIQHHLKVLEKNNLVTREDKQYDNRYFITTFLKQQLPVFYEIVNRKIIR